MPELIPPIPMTMQSDGTGGRCLAGLSPDGESVVVLVKVDAETFDLHTVPVSDAEQTLRSFLDVDSTEAHEIAKAIQSVRPPAKPKCKPRKRKAA